MRRRLFFADYPATFGLLALLVVAFLIAWASPDTMALAQLQFQMSRIAAAPWTLFTYPLFQPPGGVIYLIFEWLWLFMAGREVERRMGSRGVLLSFIIGAALCAIGYGLGCLIHGEPGRGLFYPEHAILCLTVLWASYNPESEICIWGVIRLKFKIFALVIGIIVVLHWGIAAPFAGVLGAAPALLFWMYGRRGLEAFGIKKKEVRDARGRQYKDEREFDEFIDNVRNREKERADRERLRKLFEDSMDEDDKR